MDKDRVSEETPQKSGESPFETVRSKQYTDDVLSSAKKLESKIKSLEQRREGGAKEVRKRLFADSYSRELFDKKVSSAVNIPFKETVYKDLTPLEFDTAAFLSEMERKPHLKRQLFKPRKKDPEPPLTFLETTKTYQEEPSFRNVYRPPTYSLQGASPGHSYRLYECVTKLDNLDLS